MHFDVGQPEQRNTLESNRLRPCRQKSGTKRATPEMFKLAASLVKSNQIKRHTQSLNKLKDSPLGSSHQRTSN